jgi:hypothetical protein
MGNLYAEHDTAERTLVKANVTKREAKKLVNPVEGAGRPLRGLRHGFRRR